MTELSAAASALLPLRRWLYCGCCCWHYAYTHLIGGTQHLVCLLILRGCVPATTVVARNVECLLNASYLYTSEVNSLMVECNFMWMQGVWKVWWGWVVEGEHWYDGVIPVFSLKPNFSSKSWRDKKEIFDFPGFSSFFSVLFINQRLQQLCFESFCDYGKMI